MANTQELLNKIHELEEKLRTANQKQHVRKKIENMSSEVVDSNPYR